MGAAHLSSDALGNRIRQTDARGIVTEYDYDALNRVTAIRHPSAPVENIHYTWDTGPFGIGRLARITDASGSTEYRYDAHGRVTERINTVRGTTLPLLMGYDADGQLSSLMHADGREISYSRDAAGRINAVTLINPDGSETVLASDIRWSPFGPLRELTYGNGLVHTRAHDRSGRVTAITTPGVQSLLLGWDTTDNLTALTDGLSPALSQLFAYDPLHRLTQAQGGYGLRAFDYDALGNRTRLTTDVSVTDYAYAQDSNRLASVGGTAYTYDAAGNTLTDGERQFSYDARNRMAEADGHRYGYNALNLRVFKPRMGVAGDITGDGQVTEQDLGLLQQALRGDVPTTMAMDCNQDGVVDQRDTACIARKIGAHRNQGQTRGRGNQGPPAADSQAQEPVQLGWVLFVYDEQGQLVGEYDEQRNPLRLYVWLEHMPIAMLDSSGIHYLHTDHLHTPRAATDEGGTTTWQAHFTPFGEVTETVSQIEMNLRFPGQYHDRETGLHQNWHREYAPHLGRYTQSDPIGVIGGTNLYRYANANPTRWFDSTGLTPECKGSWKYMGFRPQLPRVLRLCFCYWLCMDCRYPSAWSGILESLPTTSGQLFFDPTVRGPSAGDVEAGNSCLCYSRPGPETGCSCDGDNK